jgi:hypothetical protein
MNSGFEGTKNRLHVIERYSVHILVLHSSKVKAAGRAGSASEKREGFL